jgi:hypothetical protein
VIITCCGIELEYGHWRYMKRWVSTAVDEWIRLMSRSGKWVVAPFFSVLQMLLEHTINHDRPDPLGISSMGR